MARPRAGHPRSYGSVVLIGQAGGVDEEMLIRAQRGLGEDALDVEAEQHVPPPPALREGVAHRVGAVEDLALGAQSRFLPRLDELRPRHEGVIDASKRRGLRGAVTVLQGRSEPVMILGGRDVNGAAHRPGAHEARGVEGLLHFGARRIRGAREDRVRNRGHLLALDCQHASHRGDGRSAARRGHQPLGHDAQQGQARGQGTHQKSLDSGSSKPRIAS